MEQIEAEIEVVNREVEARMRPFQAALALLDEIPGIAQRSAEQILAEIGIEMDRFPSAAHLASWARLCPGNKQSADKRQRASTGVGNPYLRSALIEAALSAIRAGRTKPNFFAARYHRLAARRGPKRAALAVAHSMLIAVYHMLREGTHCHDLGHDYLDERPKQALVRRSLRRLQELGYRVTIEAA